PYTTLFRSLTFGRIYNSYICNRMNVQFTDKIDSIFKSTLHLIKDNGFHGTPMSQIAKHADVAIGTIYHYFPSKDELILALFEYCRKELYAYIFKHVNQDM